MKQSLTWAQARLDTPYGRIEVAWHISDGRFSLTVTAPPGTTADIVLPDGTRHQLVAATKSFTTAVPTAMA